ncbi:MAG TPA: indolepyruvate ferredoxin oxidoreductase subunit alpha, partial [Candidatus Aerophobetes bacterium]|nr:indolepyruvate ferredoxin oxidoreductase subunit alpha [Candidatus Aerophobetes bacterium]
MIKREYILGNEAIAYGLLEGGVEAAYGYPGTPSSEIMEKLIELSLKYGFYAEWSVNEKVAFENAVGSSWGGRRATVIMKHVGLNVAADPFMTLAYTGTRGGFVLIVADDPSSHS